MLRFVVALASIAGLAGAVAAAPAAPDALEWQGVGRASALRWLAPGGDAVETYEVRGAELPIDDGTFDDASPLSLFPSGTPRPTGILEFRELNEVEVEDDEEPPTVLETALYFAVRGLDASGTPGPVATVGGFQVKSLRVKTNAAGQDRLVLEGRFAIRRDALDVPSGDLRVRVVQNDVTVLDETVPAAAFPATASHAVKDKVGPLRLVRFDGGLFALLTVKTNTTDLAIEPGDVVVLVDLGTRPFSAGATLREKGRNLVFP